MLGSCKDVMKVVVVNDPNCLRQIKCICQLKTIVIQLLFKGYCLTLMIILVVFWIMFLCTTWSFIMFAVLLCIAGTSRVFQGVWRTRGPGTLGAEHLVRLQPGPRRTRVLHQARPALPERHVRVAGVREGGEGQCVRGVPAQAGRRGDMWPQVPPGLYCDGVLRLGALQLW